MKRLGFGMMRPPMQGEEIDRTVMNRMVDAFIAKGFTYFDTAPSYMNGGSERMVRDTVIRRYPRASVQIASKLPLWVAEEQGLSLEEIWQESLERTEAGYFDYYLLHAMNEKLKAAADQRDAWGFVRAKKEAGLIRHIGFSFHDTPEVLESILRDHSEMEFVQLQINYADWENPKVQARACYETARRYGCICNGTGQGRNAGEFVSGDGGVAAGGPAGGLNRLLGAAVCGVAGGCGDGAVRDEHTGADRG